MGRAWMTLLTGLLLIACGEPERSERKSSAGTTDTQRLSTPDDPELDSDPGDVNTSTGTFFKDQQDFELNDIASGLMPCGGTGGKRVLSDYKIKPWPEDMKAFLSQEMAKFPVPASKLDKYFGGFYLSDTTLADDLDEDSNVHIDGLTCQNGSGGKFIVFINYQVHVVERGELGALDRFQDLFGLVDEYTVEESPDPTLATLFHELIHVIDFGEFTDGTTGYPTSVRQEIAELSWSDVEDPLFDRISVLYLNSPVDQAWDWLRHNSIHSVRQQPNFALMATPNQLADDFKYLAEDTNFISPYSMTNMFEDLAASMEIYYVGTRYDKWMVRTIYDRNIVDGTSGADEVYRFDTEKIAKNSSDHRTKLCSMAETILGDTCQLK